jgi:hypothetical protein
MAFHILSLWWQRVPMTDSGPAHRQHAVIVHLKLSDQAFGSFDERERAFALEDRLEDALSRSAVAEYDGHEFGGGWCRFYVYGDDANAIATLVAPIVAQFSRSPSSVLIKRFGPPGAPQEECPLASEDVAGQASIAAGNDSAHE